MVARVRVDGGLMGAIIALFGLVWVAIWVLPEWMWLAIAAALIIFGVADARRRWKRA